MNRKVNKVNLIFLTILVVSSGVFAYVELKSGGEVESFIPKNEEQQKHVPEVFKERTEGAYQEGVRQAQRELEQGKLGYRIYGMPCDIIAEFMCIEILKKDYGINLYRVAACMVTQELLATTRGYNETMHKAIMERFGKDVLEIAWEKARAERSKKPKIVLENTSWESLREELALNEEKDVKDIRGE